MGDVNQQQTEETPDVEQEQPAPEPEKQDEAAQEEPPEKPETEAEEAEGEGEEEQPDEAAQAAAAEKKHKRAGGYQRKLERLERANALLLEQLQRAGKPQQPDAPAKELTPQEQAAKYVESLVEQRLAAKEAEAQQRAAQEAFARRTAEVRQAHADFDDALESVSDVPVSQAMQEALLTSEHGPAIMYQLAKSPAELARISALPPLKAALEIGRLDARLASSTATPPKPKPPPSRPPAPPSPVSGSPASTRSLEDLPISEYKRAFRTKGR